MLDDYRRSATLWLVMSNRTTVPEATLSELAQGQSYFREHLQHASARIEELEAGKQIAEANIAALQKENADLRFRIASSSMEQRQIHHDLAVHLRWQALQQCGVDVFSDGQHNVGDADKRLGSLADMGEANIREELKWVEAKS